jgi:hypothetical protein
MAWLQRLTRSRSAFFLVGLSLASGVSESTSLAAELHVAVDGSGPYATIADALEASEAGDVIVLGDGVFQGDGNRSLVVPDHDLTIRSVSGDPARTLLDAEGSAADYQWGIACWFRPSPVAVTIEGIAVTGGYVTGSVGAAVHVESDDVVLRRCWFYGNVATDDWGGTIVDWGGDLTSSLRVEECLVVGNVGNGLSYFGDDLLVSRCTLADNGWAGLRVSTPGVPVRGSLSAGRVEESLFWGSCRADLWVVNIDLELDRCLFPEGSVDTDLAGRVIFLSDPLHDDPLFCDHLRCDGVPHDHPGDYTLAKASPGLPAQNPWGVQLGAFGIGCATTPVEPMSWSELKARHR